MEPEWIAAIFARDEFARGNGMRLAAQSVHHHAVAIPAHRDSFHPSSRIAATAFEPRLSRV